MRPSVYVWAMDIALATSKRSTCVRRSVGCVLLDQQGKILATGYNGVPKGVKHCNEGHPCAGANMPSGSGLDSCRAVHAEANALIQCPNVKDIKIVVSTTFPCIHCLKMLLNSGMEVLIYKELYADMHKQMELLKERNITILKIKERLS